MKRSRAWTTLWCAASALILSACGGGGGGDTPPPSPSAAIVAPPSVVAGDTVQLDGSRSTGTGSLRYGWTLPIRPQGSTAALNDAAAAQPSFVADQAGVYRAELVVSDNNGRSAPHAVDIVATKPVPIARPSQTTLQAKTGEPVTLDATASTSPNALPLAYRWTLQSRPARSTATLDGAATARPTLLPDVDGAYVLQLVVSDSNDSSAPVEVRVVAAGTAYNVQPVANAGTLQTVQAGTPVALDGSGSTDANGDPLTYRWIVASAPKGSQVATNTLRDRFSARPGFTPDVVGDYTLGLYVHDSQVESTVSRVVVKAAKDPAQANRAPVALVAPWRGNNQDQTSNRIYFAGSGSYDADGDALTHRFVLAAKPAGSNAALQVINGNASLQSDAHGDYTVQLIVNDGKVDSAPVTHTIRTSASPDLAPTASISTPANSLLNQTVQLDGSGSSDPEGRSLGYRWTMETPQGSRATLSSDTAARPTFVPDVPGPYQIALTVNDGSFDSEFKASATVVAKTINRPPTAAPIFRGTNVIPGMRLTFSDANIIDPDGDRVYAAWRLKSVPPGSALSSITSPTSPTGASIVPDVPGRYVVGLVATDRIDDSEAYEFAIDVASARTGLALDMRINSDASWDMSYFSHKTSSSGVSFGANVSGAQSIRELRLHAIDRAYTIVDLSATEDNQNHQPRFVNLREGQTIAAGESIEVALETPAVTSADLGKPIYYTFYFRIKETGEEFYYRANVTRAAM